jgi:transcriptional regulator with PAS, ATPase and Fis domain
MLTATAPSGPVSIPHDRPAADILLERLAEVCRGDGRVVGVRARFEETVRGLLDARSVRLRDLRDAVQRPQPPGRVLLEVPGGPEPLALLEIDLREGRLEPSHESLLAAARRAAVLVLALEAAVGVVARQAIARFDVPPLVGSSAALAALRERVSRVAPTDFTILVEGESGVGKELVARHIHALSRRRHGPFVAVNCAAIVETLVEAELFGIEDRTATGVRGRRGRFELADGGTLFLDEVSDLSPAAQAKLLRVLQERAVERVGGSGPRRIDARIVAATNRSLADLVARGLFREDLFYRLNGVEILVPPLRRRREDIPELARHFLDRHRGLGARSLAASALDALLAYDWPGNVRELERAIERAVALAAGHQIRLEDLPPPVARGYTALLMPSLERGDTLRAWAARYVRLVLERCGGNKRRACHALDISYHTLQSYLHRPVAEPAECRADPTSRPAG